MSNDIIRAAIEARLLAWAKAQTPAMPIAFANTDYAPSAGQCYLQGHLMPADTLNPSQGGLHKRYNGIYQVSIRTPAGKGTTDSLAIAGALEELFRCSTTLPKGGINVHIDSTPAIGPGANDGNGFWMTPVTISYHADSFA